ncbi:MAG: PAS domain-containing protein [Lacunisphaera sp.]|nr:PAS domain-containing protein [Lacunisphaera sp.]
MRVYSVTPVNVPRDFGIEEIFFSTTDPKGIIRSGNAVFVRVSGHPLEELIGQPHNIIRHPDMPRAVFRLLWDCLQQGRPIAALVKNMARDGCYYWVIALITPVAGGYLSVRFKPSSEISGKLMDLYARMRAVEREHGDGGTEGRAGMDAAASLLDRELRQLGFADYDSFMWKFLHAEMKSRDGLTRGAPSSRPGPPPAGGGKPVETLYAIYQGAADSYAQINALYLQLDELTTLNDRLTQKSAAVNGLTLGMRFVALTTTIKAAKLGEEGRGLEVIAQYLSDASASTAVQVGSLTGRVREIAEELRKVIFNLSAARLQLEMMQFFGRELLAVEAGAAGGRAAAGASRQAMIRDLQQAFQTTMVQAVEILGACGRHLAGLNTVAEELRRTILTLHIAQMGGKVEASRIHGDDSIGTVLGEIHAAIGKTSGELDEIEDITVRFTRLIRAAPPIAQAITGSLARIEEKVRQLDVQEDSPAPAPVAAAGAPGLVAVA